MKRLVQITALLLWAAPCLGQAWSGVIDPTRANPYWPNAGAAIINRSTICTTLGAAGQLPSFAQSVTQAQLDNAVTACNNGVVLLNPGTYAVNIKISKSNVTVRGSGADQTNISPTGTRMRQFWRNGTRLRWQRWPMEWLTRPSNQLDGNNRGRPGSLSARSYAHNPGEHRRSFRWTSSHPRPARRWQYGYGEYLFLRNGRSRISRSEVQLGRAGGFWRSRRQPCADAICPRNCDRRKHGDDRVWPLHAKLAKFAKPGRMVGNYTRTEFRN
jgi:hypothetical protein